MTTYRKKLIEVALPLDAINTACKPETENPFLKRHPRSLHVWWARTPLVACRAVIFASLVDDPDEPNAPKDYLEALDKLEKPPTGADGRRDRLFYFIERLVKWESTTDEKLLDTARKLIRLSCEGKPPPVLDPFCGRGSIPMEAVRLGLEAYASDLNPVAVLITKALIEIPPKFAGKPPVNPDDRAKLQEGAAWKGAAGLAADVRYYGKWMRDRAWERIGHLYPKGPNGETVIAWLWARTVKCPNPACGAQMPLVRSFWLSKRKGKEAWIEPLVDKAAKTVRFIVGIGRPADSLYTEAGAGFVNEKGKMTKSTFRCLVCEQGVAKGEYIDEEASRTGLAAVPLAKVVEGPSGRLHEIFSETEAMAIADTVGPYWQDEGFQSRLPRQECRGTFASNAQGRRYGFDTFADYFAPRQLVALTALGDLVSEARDLVLQHSDGDRDHADAIATYLAFAVSRLTDYHSTLCTWNPTNGNVSHVFVRQAIPMTWDFAEANAVGNKLDILVAAGWVADGLASAPAAAPQGRVDQLDATRAVPTETPALLVTDPPYYDNISYADLADYFYVWLRRMLSAQYPQELSTLLTPKAHELVASQYQHGQNAEEHFRAGMALAWELLKSVMDQSCPWSVFYAYKQADESGPVDGSASTGWETMLHGLIEAGLQITATWPMRTTKSARSVAQDTNALASAIVLVGRLRPETAPIATFRQFQSELGEELPAALSVMTGRDRADHSEPWVDPIDLRQAAIGPGMAVYSRYSRVQKADGTALSVREALQEINEAIDRYFDEMEGDLDPDTRFCLNWYKEAGFGKGKYGRAEVLAQAINVGVEAIERKGLLDAKGGDVNLRQPRNYSSELPAGPSIWELCHRLVGALEEGEGVAARLYNAMPGLAEEASGLAYRLYLEAEKKNRAEDALGYNALVASWTDVRRKATELREESQGALPLSP